MGGITSVGCVTSVGCITSRGQLTPWAASLRQDTTSVVNSLCGRHHLRRDITFVVTSLRQDTTPVSWITFVGGIKFVGGIAGALHHLRGWPHVGGASLREVHRPRRDITPCGGHHSVEGITLRRASPSS